MSTKSAHSCTPSILCTGTLRWNLTAILSLGALWIWFFGAGNSGSVIFGLSVEDTVPFRVGCQCLCGLLLFGFSLCGSPFARVPMRVQIKMGTVGCLTSACLYRLGMWLNVPLAVAGACVLVAASYASLLRVWIHRFRCPFGRLFTIVLGASACTMVVCLSTYLLSARLGFGLALGGAAVAGALLCRACADAAQQPSPSMATPGDMRSFVFQCAGVTVAYLAGSLLNMGVMGSVEEWAYLSLLGSAALACWALWRAGLPPAQSFIGLCLFICLCIACVVVGGVSLAILGTLVSAAFWLMFLFAVAWLGAWDCEHATVSGSLFLRGMAALLLCSALAKLVAYLNVPTSSLLLFCALLTAVGLAVFFMGGLPVTRAAGDGFQGDESCLPVYSNCDVSAGVSDLEERCRALAQTSGLTDREARMLVLLARGNSLKKAAEVLYMSEGTAKYHRHNLYVKLDVTTRQELIDLVGASCENVVSSPGQKG